jgi:hypothetical protein
LKKCKSCSREFQQFRTTDKYCSYSCAKKEGKIPVKKLPKDNDEFERQRAKLDQLLIERHGQVICEVHGIECEHEWMGLQTHHIVYRSERKHHPMLHNVINLIKCCIPGHNWFHEKKSNRNQLMKERGLDEIFGVYVE